MEPKIGEGRVTDRPRPLAGVRIVDLTQMASATFGTMLLADAGAEVVKVEPPNGDLIRSSGPPIGEHNGRPIEFGSLRYGRGKKSIALNLKSDEGREILLELVRKGDVLTENYTPGTMEKLGVGWSRLRDVNPRLIYACVSGFGHTDIYQSPYADRPAMDAIAQAYSGIMSLTGQPGGPPTMVGTTLGDQAPGLFLAYGIMLALWQRQMTGVGQLVDVSMYDSLLALCEYAVMNYSLTGKERPRGRHMLGQPYDSFEAADGHIVICAAPNNAWQRLCQAIERPDLAADVRLAGTDLRANNYDDLIRPVLAEWARARTRDEIIAYLATYDIPAAPVQSIADIFQCPHVAARNMLRPIGHPATPTYVQAGNPVKMSLAPEPSDTPPPLLGEHTDDVLGGLLGLDADRIARLRDRGVVG